MKKVMICLITCLLTIYSLKAQNSTFTSKDSVLWKEFGSFLDSAKLKTVENFYENFCIYICKDFYVVTFAFDCNQHWNNGVTVKKNDVDIPYTMLPILKQKIILAMKQKKLREKTIQDETIYKIGCF